MKPEVLSNKTKHGVRTNQDHCTPEFLWTAIINYAPIALDPCSNMWSSVPAMQAYSIDLEEDGLALPWPETGLVYLNPEFGNLRPWVERCNQHAVEAPKAEMIMVCPFSPQTKWFRAGWEGRVSVGGAWPRRICWDGAGKRPAFTTAVLYWGKCTQAFVEWLRFNDCPVFLPS